MTHTWPPGWNKKEVQTWEALESNASINQQKGHCACSHIVGENSPPITPTKIGPPYQWLKPSMDSTRDRARLTNC